MPVDGIDRSNLEKKIIREIRKGRPWEPDIWLVEGNTKRVIIKDYRSRSFLYREGIGLISVWNEARMYAKLKGIEGVPECYGKLDRHAIALQYIQGRNASEVSRGELSKEFFTKLRNTVDSVHQRGVVLCDLRNKKNVMVTDRYEPFVIDLCTAFHRGSRWNIVRRFLFGIFFQDDLLGIIKLKSKRSPHLLSKEEEEKLNRGVMFQKEAVAVRNFCVRWLKKMVGSS